MTGGWKTHFTLWLRLYLDLFFLTSHLSADGTWIEPRVHGRN